MNYQFYKHAIAYVLHHTDATERRLLRRVKLAGGVPYRFIGEPAAGPQCLTINIQIRDEDLTTVEGLGDRFAMAAGSEFSRVYRDRSLVRIEFTLPKSQWADVHLARLPHRLGSATFGQTALGPPARMGWDVPHKAVFGTSQSGKTTCLADLVISLARSHSPDDCRFLLANPKNDKIFHPFQRLTHLAAPVANDYADSVALLRYALAEMELRRQDNSRCGQRWVVVVDEIAQLTEVNPETGPLITQLSQLAGGLNINLVVASQAANPKVFGKSGSLAKANFASRLVFQLPREQSWLATNIEGQLTDKLGGAGDGLAIINGRVSRFRSARPLDADYDALDYLDQEPDPIPVEALAGDRAIDKWQIDPDPLAYALVYKASATAIRKQFGGGTSKAMEVRDFAALLRGRVRHWRKIKAQEAS